MKDGIVLKEKNKEGNSNFLFNLNDLNFFFFFLCFAYVTYRLTNVIGYLKKIKGITQNLSKGLIKDL
jgi:hypothetical protein